VVILAVVVVAAFGAGGYMDYQASRRRLNWMPTPRRPAGEP
jgi:hypothetical protein